MGNILPILANAATAPVGVDDFKSVLEVIQSQISVSTVVTVLGVAVGASVGFAFMWWGVNKLKAAIMKGFKKGKI